MDVTAAALPLSKTSRKLQVENSTKYEVRSVRIMNSPGFTHKLAARGDWPFNGKVLLAVKELRLRTKAIRKTSSQAAMTMTHRIEVGQEVE
jgi:hypothetical protein